MMQKRLRIACLSALLLAACSTDETVAPDGWVRRVGVIDPALSSIQLLSLPAEVRLGEPVAATVRTLGSSSCTRVHDTQLDVNGLSVDITPRDEYAPEDTACTADIHAFPHDVTWTFKTAGQARVTVHGRGHDGRDIAYDVTVNVR